MTHESSKQRLSNGIQRRDMLTFLAASAGALPNIKIPTALCAPYKTLRGVMPIVTTPYSVNGAVDFDDLAREMIFYNRCGAQGAIWPQASSDVSMLSKDERMRGMEVLANACRPLNVSIVLGVQGATTAEMLEYANRAEELAPDAMIAMPPSAEQSMEAYHTYYSALAKVTKRPVLIQTSLPGVPNALAPSLELIFQLAREFPNLGYVKEEARPVHDRMRRELQERTLMKGVYGASGGNAWLLEMRIGTDGEATGQGMYADVMAKIWNFYQSGRKAAAADAFAKLLLMKNCQEEIPGTERYIFKKRGVFKSTVARKNTDGKVEIINPELTPEEIGEIDFRFATLKPLLVKDA